MPVSESSRLDGILSTPVGPEDHYRGPANAPIVLVEYGDYECPHCGRAYEVLQEILAELGDEVGFVFRHFPLTKTHPDAEPAAEAAESVARHGGNGAFWAMHDMLYLNQDALEESDLLGYAEAAGVNPRVVADDLSTEAVRARVRTDFTGGVSSGVNGTPTFFVNGERFEGQWSDPGAFAAALRAAARSTVH
ncbi:MAG: DsbA family protein [Vicinamibacterales bacterium]